MSETRAADRLCMFSDAVIAVIITIMVLELKPGRSRPCRDVSALR